MVVNGMKIKITNIKFSIVYLFIWLFGARI